MVDVTDAHRRNFAFVALFLEIVFVVLFATTTEYDDNAKATSANDVSSIVTEMDHYYPLFQDVHVMIFIGFGFLMTFLKKYGFGSVGFNFMLSALVVQWSMLVNGFFHQVLTTNAEVCNTRIAEKDSAGAFLMLKYGSDHPFDHCTWHTIKLGITNLITSDFAAGAVMISFGAMLGKASPIQLMFMGIMEIIVYAMNETIGAGLFSAVDMGGSIFVHTFGAYFGLAVSFVVGRTPDAKNDEHDDNGSDYKSDLFAMIGTVFLWMFWPSFNGALATESQQHRVVINTVLALSACCMSAFAFSALLRKHHKFDMVDIQNATLAGGVAVGSSADLVIQPYGAIIIGLIAGLLSVVGYVYIQPALKKSIGLDDTCGVHNLHGMPGVMGAVGGCISASIAGGSSGKMYGATVGNVFPARCGSWGLNIANQTMTTPGLYHHVVTNDASDFSHDNKAYSGAKLTELVQTEMKRVTGCDAPGDGRTAGSQASYQIAALGVTLVFAIVGGAITGLLMKLCAGPQGQADYAQWYNDEIYWETPEEDEGKPLVSGAGGKQVDGSAIQPVGGDEEEVDVNV